MLIHSSEFSYIKFEFTSAGTPQQNGTVERAFPTLLGRAKAMLNNAGLTGKSRKLMWAECARTATMLENAMPNKLHEDPPYLKFYKKQYNWINYLRTFGEIAIIKKLDNPSKLENKGVIGMFTGYCDDHAKGTYRFVNLKTGKLIISRNIKWIHKTWAEFHRDKHKLNIIEEEDLEETEEAEIVEEDENIYILEDEELSDDPIRPKTTKLERELKKLNTSYNTVVPNETIELALLMATNSGPTDPNTFKQAWEHTNEESKIKWREAIKKEYDDMISKGVWRYRKIKELPSNRKIIGSKWVFKTKKNGVHRARLVALGYSQIPGVDYTDNFAPVVHDVTYRLILIQKLIHNYEAEIIDVETAFLYGNLEEKIYMKIPDGLSNYVQVSNEDCLELKKSIYGLVQAARQWWKEFVGYLTEKVNFKKSIVDPCLLYKEENSNKVYLCLYVDDVLLIGNQSLIKSTISDIKEKYSIKEIGKLDEYVGCKIHEFNNTLYIQQPDLITKLVNQYSNKFKNQFEYVTPAGHGEQVVRPKTKEELVNDEDQKISEVE